MVVGVVAVSKLAAPGHCAQNGYERVLASASAVCYSDDVHLRQPLVACDAIRERLAVAITARDGRRGLHLPVRQATRQSPSTMAGSFGRQSITG